MPLSWEVRGTPEAQGPCRGAVTRGPDDRNAGKSLRTKGLERDSGAAGAVWPWPPREAGWGAGTMARVETPEATAAVQLGEWETSSAPGGKDGGRGSVIFPRFGTSETGTGGTDTSFVPGGRKKPLDFVDESFLGSAI